MVVKMIGCMPLAKLAPKWLPTGVASLSLFPSLEVVIAMIARCGLLQYAACKACPNAEPRPDSSVCGLLLVPRRQAVADAGMTQDACVLLRGREMYVL